MEIKLTSVHLSKFVFVFNAKYPKAPRAFRPFVVYFTHLGTCCSRRRTNVLAHRKVSSHPRSLPQYGYIAVSHIKYVLF